VIARLIGAMRAGDFPTTSAGPGHPLRRDRDTAGTPQAPVTDRPAAAGAVTPAAVARPDPE